MTTPSRNSYSEKSVIELPASFGEGGQSLDSYLVDSTQELNAITELVSRGETADRGCSHRWISLWKPSGARTLNWVMKCARIYCNCFWQLLI